MQQLELIKMIVDGALVASLIGFGFMFVRGPGFNRRRLSALEQSLAAVMTEAEAAGVRLQEGLGKRESGLRKAVADVEVVEARLSTLVRDAEQKIKSVQTQVRQAVEPQSFAEQKAPRKRAVNIYGEEINSAVRASPLEQAVEMERPVIKRTQEKRMAPVQQRAREYGLSASVEREVTSAKNAIEEMVDQVEQSNSRKNAADARLGALGTRVQRQSQVL